MKRLSATKGTHVAFIISVFIMCLAVAAPAQTFSKLVDFDGSTGATPNFMAILQGGDGNFYGTTSSGGANNSGTVFRVTAAGRLTTLYSFCSQPNCVDGNFPQAGLTLSGRGNLYGVTSQGGAAGMGTIFRITPTGDFGSVYSFCSKANCADGSTPYGQLVMGSDGNYYGTTYTGGVNNVGTIFKITVGGQLTTLHSFSTADGANPFAGLVQASNGAFYGTTVSGGNNDLGTVFQIASTGAFAVLHSFNLLDGSAPHGRLVQGSNAKFYGTTTSGGDQGNGTVFSMTANGGFTTLHKFEATDGAAPYAGVIQATDGNFYGTTSAGGANLLGSIFQMTPAGVVTSLHDFVANDGEDPNAELLQATSGLFYGSAPTGGASGVGSLYTLSVGLGPFVQVLPQAGKVNSAVYLLGPNVGAATAVSFNGTPSKFSEIASTVLRTSVPDGALTGPISVTTPGGTLQSNVIFRVTPQVLSFSPPSGPVGTVVTITGVSLTQALGVGFGDYTPAMFTVNSDKQVTATVPNGAKTGPVGVETKAGIGLSSKVFTVTP